MEPSNTEPCDGSSSSLNDTHSGIVTTTISYSSSLQVGFVTKLFGTVVEHQLANNINALSLAVISHPSFKTYENDFKRQERSDPAFQDEICSLVADPAAVMKSMEDDEMVQEFATKMKEKIKEKMKSHPKPDVPLESFFDVIWEILKDIVEMIIRDHLKEAKQLGRKIMAFLSRNIKVILVRFNRLITVSLSLSGRVFGWLKLINPTYIVYFFIMMLVVILAIIIYRHVYTPWVMHNNNVSS